MAGKQVFSQAIILLCLLILATPHTAALPSLQPTATEDATANLTILADAQTSGSSCSGSEGQWNCMTSSWQRCASGRWSVVMQCAAGTICTPAGLTNDFKVQASSPTTTSSGGASVGSGRAAELRLLWVVSGVYWCLGLVL